MVVEQASPLQPHLDPVQLAERFRSVRWFSDELCEPLEPEDCVIQSMPDVSPTRWHLAHTTWFFETFLLQMVERSFERYHPDFEVLFNSYYNTVGEQFPRSRRGLLSRPTVREVQDYRADVDERVLQWLDNAAEQPDETTNNALRIVELGLQHEQQHQELMLTDIKHVFSCNPLWPAYQPAAHGNSYATPSTDVQWCDFDGGLVTCGMDSASTQFAFDNEYPAHQVLTHPFELADRLVTCGEYLNFIEDGGYRRPELWLSLGWSWVQSERRECPLYWYRQLSSSGERAAESIPTNGKEPTEWRVFTLSGLQPLDTYEPVCHVSYFEADAYARWAGARLPTEFEWELAATALPWQSACDVGNFAEQRFYHPRRPQSPPPHSPPKDRSNGLPSVRQMPGDAWEWTSSAYAAYPGYRAPHGALGEYNGKFMCNQFVLRGGSCVTSRDHIRATYRNFFPPEASWQFTGIRLARDVSSRD